MIVGPDGKAIKQGEHQVSEAEELIQSINKNMFECMPGEFAQVFFKIATIGISVNAIEKFLAVQIMKTEQVYRYNQIYLEQCRKCAAEVAAQAEALRPGYQAYLKNIEKMREAREAREVKETKEAKEVKEAGESKNS